CRPEPGERPAEHQPERHRGEDPERQKPVERRKLLDDRRPGHPAVHELGNVRDHAGEQPQSGPQQDSFAVGSVRGAATFPGLVPRTNALMNLPSIIGAMAATSIPVPARNAAASFVSYTRVGSMDGFWNPASVSS